MENGRPSIFWAGLGNVATLLKELVGRKKNLPKPVVEI